MNEGVLENELRGLTADVAEIKNAVHRVLEAQNAATVGLARMDERWQNHAAALTRAFSTLDGHEGRIKQIELEQPLTKMVRGWVIAAVLSMVSVVGIGGYAVYRVADRPMQITIQQSQAKP